MDASQSRGMRVVGGLLLGLVAAATPTGPARGQTSPAPAAPRTAPDPALEAARLAFEALAEAERRGIQDALVWTGDYTGLIDGSFGRQTFDAIAAYQRRVRQVPNGTLDAKARAELRAAAQQAREAVGFTVADDPRSGVRIGVPERLLAKKEANAHGGTRWQSRDEKITLDTRSLPDPPGGLQSLYDRNLAIQTPGRQVTYKVIRPDFFVIAGETPAGRFYTRYASGPGGLRGFSIGYDKALAKDADRLVVAIANSFVPFPGPGSPAVAAAPSPPPPGPSASSAAAPAPTPDARPAAPPVAGLVGTGLVVAPGQVATTVSPDACRELLAAGTKPRQVRSVERLTLLDLGNSLKVAPVALAGRAEGGLPLLVLAYRRQGTQDELVAVPALAQEDGSVSGPLQGGARGAPVFDLSGALRGLVEGRPEERRMVAGIVPPARYRLASEGLSGLVKADPPPDPAAIRRTAGDLVSSLRAGVVPITCAP